MSDRQNDDREHRVTTDRDRIREWGEERNAVPASRESAGGAGTEYGFFRRENVDEEYREHEWDEFLDRFESEDRALVYREGETVGEDEIGHYEIIDRDEAATRMTVEDEEVEEELLSGETVTTEVTETTVVEREIVETETIESEVVDEEIVRSRITDAELIDWEVSDPDVDFDVRADENVAGTTVIATSDGTAQYEDLDLDTRVDGDITAEIDETWRVRREVDERATVESRVVDTDVEEHDSVEDETVEASIDTEGVHRSLVESGVIDTDTDADTSQMVDTDVIETERTDEGRFESRLVERKVYDDQIRRRKRIRFDYAGSDVIGTETLDSDLVESDVVAVDYDEDEEVEATATGVDTDTGTGAGDDTGAYGETTATDAAVDDATGEGRTEFVDDDVGKTVVDEDGDEVGQISRVAGDLAYVEPHTGFFERMESMLGMSDHDEDEYPLRSDQVRRITDDDVVISDAAEADIEADADNDRNDRR